MNPSRNHDRAFGRWASLLVVATTAVLLCWCSIGSASADSVVHAYDAAATLSPTSTTSALNVAFATAAADSTPSGPSVAAGLASRCFSATEDSMTLYRNVGSNELRDVLDNQSFRQGGNSLEGKWFWENLSDAEKFRANPTFGKPNIVSVQVPRAYGESLWNGGTSSWDGIGPARFVGPENLDEFNSTFWGLTQHG